MGMPLFPASAERRLLEVVYAERQTSVLVNGCLYMRWEGEDETAKRMAIVQLYEAGIGNQAELSKAFGVHVNSVGLYISRFKREGVDGLIEQPKGPRKRWKLLPEMRKLIFELAAKEGVEGYEKIRRRLKGRGVHVSRGSIAEVLKENGLTDGQGISDEEEGQSELFDAMGEGRQLGLDFPPNSCSAVKPRKAETGRRENAERSVDALAEVHPGAKSQYSHAQRAYLDHLEQGDYNAYAGGLLLSPLIERYSFLPMLQRMIGIDFHEGYSLEQMCLTLFYLDVFGYRSVEDYKRAYAEEFGILMGHAAGPSPYSIRRFLHRVRRLNMGEELIDAFAQEYLRSGIAEWGVVYIDGHFMPYYGLSPIMKGWHGVMQKGMKGSYSFLGVDAHFTPWIFLVRSSLEDLLQKIPEIILKAREIGARAGIGEQQLERLVVIFDREGYSGQLYRLLDGREEGARRVLFLSWAKYADKWVYSIPDEEFDKTVVVEYEIRKAERMSYHETERMMSKYGKIRAVVIESGKGKRRAAIYTNSDKEELSSEEVVRLICRRWGEENLIKELMVKHMIDYTPGYVREFLGQQPLVNNPRLQELRQSKAHLGSELSRFKIALADCVVKEAERKTEQLSKDRVELLTAIVRVEVEIRSVEEQIKALPQKVPFPEAHDGERLLQLNYEKKRFLDCIKVFVYNLEKLLCVSLLRYYDRRKEVYPALSMIMRRGGYVKLEGGRLKVRLRRFQNPEIDYAARHLCEEVNEMEPVTLDKYRFPLHFGVS
jgi:transposase